MRMQDAVGKEFGRGRVRAGRWGFAIWIVGALVSAALGLPPLLAVVMAGVLAGVVLLSSFGEFR